MKYKIDDKFKAEFNGEEMVFEIVEIREACAASSSGTSDAGVTLKNIVNGETTDMPLDWLEDYERVGNEKIKRKK